MADVVSLQQERGTSGSSSSEPLQGLVLAPQDPLENAQAAGRRKCSSCSGSRMFYCYSCCVLVGLSPLHVPTVKLPVKIDIIKHPNETDGKSTAVHAKLISPDDVSIYTYPCIPDLDKHNVVLVFPGPDALTVEELMDHFCKNGVKRVGENPANERPVKKLKVEEESENTHSKTQTCNTEHTDDTHTHTCPVQRVVFIDSTWNQTTRIITDERLQALPRVELKSRRTCFWRHQRGSPDTYLATIEAIYYFLKDFHVHCLLKEYHGEYDNLLFFYSFLHKLITKAKRDAGKS